MQTKLFVLLLLLCSLFLGLKTNFNLILLVAQKQCSLHHPDHSDLCFLDLKCNGIKGNENHVFVDPIFGDDNAVGNSVSFGDVIRLTVFRSRIHLKLLKKGIVLRSRRKEICTCHEGITKVQVRYMW
jgi:hypothetical protein